MMFFGMTLPMFQSGDAVRPGMAVAEIPDLKNWEIGANIGELDRGHLSVGQKVGDHDHRAARPSVYKDA